MWRAGQVAFQLYILLERAMPEEWILVDLCLVQQVRMMDMAVIRKVSLDQSPFYIIWILTSNTQKHT